MHGARSPQPGGSSNNQLSLHQMCVAGLGITRCILAVLEDEMRQERLEVLLPEWRFGLFREPLLRVQQV